MESSSPGQRDVGPDPFQTLAERQPRGTPAFGEMVTALRRVQDLAAGSNPPEDVLVSVRAELESIEKRLSRWEVAEREAPAGKRPDDPGRGHPFLPPFVIVEQTDDRVDGRVRLSRLHLGGNGAAHGGTAPLLFDEVLGIFANSGGRAIARTAYLKVDYRSIAPVGPELAVTAWFVREDGRKRLLRGELRHDDTLCAEAEGLFVTLRPGQP
jgi:acyl-coenzyme A thioesterase PaaI-like protein